MDNPIPYIPTSTHTTHSEKQPRSLVPLAFTSGLLSGFTFLVIATYTLPPSPAVLGTTDTGYQNPFEIIEQQLETQPSNPFENLR